MSEATGPLAASAETGRHWGRSLGLLGLLILGILALYHTAAEAAVHVWLISPTFNHCLLILPTSAYLVWQRRALLRDAAPSLSLPTLLLLLPLTGLWLFGQLVGVLEIEQFAMIAMIEVAILAVLGWPVYRLVLFPALFLFFLIPSGEYLIGPLQRFTTDFIAIGLDLAGIPAYIEGTVIELGNGTFQVAEACAGLRFLIATIVVGVLFAHLYFTRPVKIILFMIACFWVPVIANGFRALGIVLLAHATDNRVAAGADHIIYGWGFSVVILFVLLFVGARFADPPRNLTASAAARRGSVPGFSSLVAALVLTLALAAAGPALAWQRERQPVLVDSNSLKLPATLGSFTVSADAPDWHPLFLEPDAHVMAQLTEPSDGAFAQPPVGLELLYYGRMRKGRELVSSSNRLWSEEGTWRQISDGVAKVKIGGRPVEVRTAVMTSVVGKRLVWSWYWMDGRFTISKPLLKLLQLETTFSHCQGGAFIALSTPIESTPAIATARLTEAAEALGPLPDRLAGACAVGAD
ncbi:MAG TPA: exosortase A [Aliidongia sp.]|nr:exosortase A [Aliidongia sp.]